MSIQLFPRLKGFSPEDIEGMAGVSPGTYLLLVLFESLTKERKLVLSSAFRSLMFPDRVEDVYEQLEFDLIHSHPDVYRLQSFLLFGFGRPTRRVFEIIEQYGANINVGSISDPDVVYSILKAQETNVPERLLQQIREVHWA